MSSQKQSVCSLAGRDQKARFDYPTETENKKSQRFDAHSKKKKHEMWAFFSIQWISEMSTNQSCSSKRDKYFFEMRRNHLMFSHAFDIFSFIFLSFFWLF